MFKKIFLIFISITLALNTSACGKKKVSRYEAEFLLLFNTVSKIVAYTDDRQEFEKQAQFIYERLKEYHELYDIYKDYDGINNIKTINDNAGIAPVKVDKRIIDLIEYSKEWYEKTGGKINIAFGAVLKIWNQYRTQGNENPETAQLPPMEELEKASKHTDIDNIIIDKEASTVYLSDPEMSLDVGAIAKGYAVEKVCMEAMEIGFTSLLVSVGGNVRAIGSKNDRGDPWTVGVQNPQGGAGSEDIQTVNIIDCSLVTSGNYERYYTVDGKKYHHIIDPVTLLPSEYFTAISIICKDSGMADALSTSVYNMPFEQGLTFIEGLPQTSAMWVFNDGEIRYSSYFKEYIKKK